MTAPDPRSPWWVPFADHVALIEEREQRPARVPITERAFEVPPPAPSTPGLWGLLLSGLRALTGRRK